jgi:predicted ester cyclase
MTTVEENVALIRRAFAQLERGDIDGVRALTGPEYVIHPTFCDELTKSALSNFRIMLEDVIAVDDKVVTRYTIHGTHDGSLTLPGFGLIRPTGRQVAVEGIVIHRIVDGQIAEGWGCVDALEAMLELRIITPQHE